MDEAELFARAAPACRKCGTSVQRVEIRKLGGVYKRTSGKPTFWYQLLDLDPGRNIFFVRATDSSGNVSKESRVVVIKN